MYIYYFILFSLIELLSIFVPEEVKDNLKEIMRIYETCRPVNSNFVREHAHTHNIRLIFIKSQQLLHAEVLHFKNIKEV